MWELFKNGNMILKNRGLQKESCINLSEMRVSTLDSLIESPWVDYTKKQAIKIILALIEKFQKI
jgi:hypothetical protein